MFEAASGPDWGALRSASLRGAFHNRQPVVLDHVGARIWLDLGADYREVLTSPARGALAFDPPEPVAV